MTIARYFLMDHIDHGAIIEPDANGCLILLDQVFLPDALTSLETSAEILGITVSRLIWAMITAHLNGGTAQGHAERWIATETLK